MNRKDKRDSKLERDFYRSRKEKKKTRAKRINTKRKHGN